MILPCNIIQMSHSFMYWFTSTDMYCCNMKPDITVSLNRNTFMCLILLNWNLCAILLNRTFEIIPHSILTNRIRCAYDSQITINTTDLLRSRNLSKNYCIYMRFYKQFNSEVSFWMISTLNSNTILEPQFEWIQLQMNERKIIRIIRVIIFIALILNTSVFFLCMNWIKS